MILFCASFSRLILFLSLDLSLMKLSCSTTFICYFELLKLSLEIGICYCLETILGLMFLGSYNLGILVNLS